MDHENGGQIPWFRIVAEGAAIVVSILLAFAIDAWWDSRQALETERDHLLALVNQFHAVRDMVDQEIGLAERAEQGVRRLIDLSPEAAVGRGPDSIGVTIARTFVVGRPNMPTGALDALVASGNVSLIGDVNLATELARWPAVMAEVHENATWLIEYRNERFVPFLRQYAGGLWTTRHSGVLADYPPTRFPPRLRDMFSDPEMESHLAATAVRLRTILDRYETVKQETDSIILHLGQRLERIGGQGSR